MARRKLGRRRRRRRRAQELEEEEQQQLGFEASSCWPSGALIFAAAGLGSKNWRGAAGVRRSCFFSVGLRGPSSSPRLDSARKSGEEQDGGVRGFLLAFGGPPSSSPRLDLARKTCARMMIRSWERPMVYLGPSSTLDLRSSTSDPRPATFDRPWSTPVAHPRPSSSPRLGAARKTCVWHSASASSSSLSSSQ